MEESRKKLIKDDLANPKRNWRNETRFFMEREGHGTKKKYVTERLCVVIILYLKGILLIPKKLYNSKLLEKKTFYFFFRFNNLIMLLNGF